MPHATLSPATTATSVEVDALLIGATGGAAGPALAGGTEAIDAALGGRLREALVAQAFRGDECEVARLSTFGAVSAPTVIVVGLGDPTKLTAESVRRSAGTGIRAAAGLGSVATTLAQTAGLEPAVAVRAATEGALLGAYDFTAYRKSSLEGRRAPVGAVTFLVPRAKDPAAVKALACAEIVAAAVQLARDLTNTPPGNLFPSTLAKIAAREADAAGCDVEVWDEKDLKKGGYGGILGVGQGSANPPRLTRVAYTHPKARRTIALVGKGITFDSGGLSLKPAAAMDWMKVDMAGAAAVLAAVTAIARLELKVNVTGWLPSAENLPSGAAIRPGDVLTMYSGKRVEVLNTDAEGRLILADALARAAEENPDVIVDVATLTGAALVALGKRTAGVMGNDDDFRARVVAAADEAGEASWAMPLPAELRKSIDSDTGDITNTGDRMGGMLLGGIFLREFVPEGTPWAHIDIAGPSWNDGEPYGYTPKGGTGAAVRTFIQLATNVAAGR